MPKSPRQSSSTRENAELQICIPADAAAAEEEKKAMAVAEEEVEEVLEEVEEDEDEEEHKMGTVAYGGSCLKRKRDRAMPKRHEKAKRKIAQISTTPQTSNVSDPVPIPQKCDNKCRNSVWQRFV